jgi:dihydrofolate reductase
MIRAILAHDKHWGIGKNNDLPWPKNSEDLKWFKESTNGSTVVMGRNTWNSLPVKPLPNRKNIVISKNIYLKSDVVEIIKPDIYKSRINLISQMEDVWIIGGSQLVNSSLDIIDELWLNNVGNDYNCDVHLPIAEIFKLFEPRKISISPFGTITKWAKK